jgi:hypothetical protein
MHGVEASDGAGVARICSSGDRQHAGASAPGESPQAIRWATNSLAGHVAYQPRAKWAIGVIVWFAPLGFHFNHVVSTFPAVLFQPLKGEPNGRFLLMVKRNIHEVYADFCRARVGIARLLPFVVRPVQQEWGARLYAQ